MEKALDLFDELRERCLVYDGVVHSTLMEAYFKHGMDKEAIETFHQQPVKPCVMDVAGFNNIIGKLCENGLLPEAKKLFAEMPDKSVNPDATTYEFLVASCFRDGRPDDAVHYFENMIKGSGESPGFRVDVGFYNKVFDGLVKIGRTNQAMEIFEKIQEKGTRPNLLSYEILVTALCNAGNLDRGLELFEQMLQSHINSTAGFNVFLLDAFEKAGRSWR